MRWLHVIESSNCCKRNFCFAVNKELRWLYGFRCSDFETSIMNGVTRRLFGWLVSRTGFVATHLPFIPDITRRSPMSVFKSSVQPSEKRCNILNLQFSFCDTLSEFWLLPDLWLAHPEQYHTNGLLVLTLCTVVWNILLWWELYRCNSWSSSPLYELAHL